MQYREHISISQMSTTNATDGISKLLLDEADGNVGKRKCKKESSFVVFEVHHKYGEYSVSSFDTEEDLRGHLEREIASYRATLGDRDISEPECEDEAEAEVEDTDKLAFPSWWRKLQSSDKGFWNSRQATESCLWFVVKWCKTPSESPELL
jgi:hypothetical protein